MTLCCFVGAGWGAKTWSAGGGDIFHTVKLYWYRLERLVILNFFSLRYATSEVLLNYGHTS